MGEGRGLYRVLVRKPDEKRPLGNSRRSWEDNIKIYFQEVGWGIGCIALAQDRDRWPAVMSAVMNIQVP